MRRRYGGAPSQQRRFLDEPPRKAPPLEEILGRYAELDALIERAIEKCRAKDAGEATRLGAGAVAKTLVLDEMLLAAKIVDGDDELRRRAVGGESGP